MHKEINTMSQKIVLLVDDSADMRTVIGDKLRGESFEVIEAANGREAMDILKKQKQCAYILISDFEMPVMNGAKLFDELEKNNFEFSHYILMTGLDREHTLITNFMSKERKNPVYLFEKPFHLGSFVKFIKELTLTNSSSSS